MIKDISLMMLYFRPLGLRRDRGVPYCEANGPRKINYVLSSCWLFSLVFLVWNLAGLACFKNWMLWSVGSIPSIRFLSLGSPDTLPASLVILLVISHTTRRP